MVRILSSKPLKRVEHYLQRESACSANQLVSEEDGRRQRDRTRHIALGRIVEVEKGRGLKGKGTI